jgi:phosphatidylinositol phospholipase C, delta
MPPPSLPPPQPSIAPLCFRLSFFLTALGWPHTAAPANSNSIVAAAVAISFAIALFGSLTALIIIIMGEPTSLVSRLTGLNPFADVFDAEDYGEEIDEGTVAGGGHSARKTYITQHELQVSHALQSFLAHQGLLDADDVRRADEPPSGKLQELVNRPHINVPFELTDRSHPLSEYYISSSHNTYLLAHQLTGKSSAFAYRTALRTGARCVEIDAWDNDDDEDEPKVTHGYTLVSHIPFRQVCETIRDVVNEEALESKDEQGYRAAPIILSLENHCNAHGQMRLVEIMKEVWGDMLLSAPVREKGHLEQEGMDTKVRLDELGSKIVLIVEYHFPEEKEDDGSDDDDGENEEEKRAHEEYRAKKKAASGNGIIPELAELGVYAQSVKPVDNSWFEHPELKNGPHDHLINVSEVQLAKQMPANNEKISIHNSKHLMRVFPKGTRINSTNLQPTSFWGIGAQICALNWQTFGLSMQLNEALFSGTDGYVLKPGPLRAGGSGQMNKGKKIKLRLHIAGATNIPLPADREEDEIRPYVTCSLVHPDKLDDKVTKRRTVYYRQHRLGFLHRGENPTNVNPIWDEVLEWEYEDNDLVFLRLLIKSDDTLARNPVFAVATVRLQYVTSDWVFIRFLDLKGKETKCAVLARFSFEEV